MSLFSIHPSRGPRRERMSSVKDLVAQLDAAKLEERRRAREEAQAAAARSQAEAVRSLCLCCVYGCVCVCACV